MLQSSECETNVQESIKCVQGYFSDCLKMKFVCRDVMNKTWRLYFAVFAALNLYSNTSNAWKAGHHSYFSFYFHMPLAVNKS